MGKFDLPAPKPMARAGVATSSAKVIDFPSTDEPPRPSAPAGNVISFPKRTVVVAIRVPPELNDQLQRSADQFYMTKGSFCLRVLHEYCERQRLPGNLRNLREAL